MSERGESRPGGQAAGLRGLRRPRICFCYSGGFSAERGRRRRRFGRGDRHLRAAGSVLGRTLGQRQRPRRVLTPSFAANALDRPRARSAARGRRFGMRHPASLPPSRKGREALAGALRGYTEINLRAMQAAHPRRDSGRTRSCSYHVDVRDVSRHAPGSAAARRPPGVPAVDTLCTQAADGIRSCWPPKETQYRQVRHPGSGELEGRATIRITQITQISSDSAYRPLRPQRYTDLRTPDVATPNDGALLPMRRVPKGACAASGPMPCRREAVPRLLQVPPDCSTTAAWRSGSSRLPPLRRPAPS